MYFLKTDVGSQYQREEHTKNWRGQVGDCMKPSLLQSSHFGVESYSSVHRKRNLNIKPTSETSTYWLKGEKKITTVLLLQFSSQSEIASLGMGSQFSHWPNREHLENPPTPQTVDEVTDFFTQNEAKTAVLWQHLIHLIERTENREVEKVHTNDFPAADCCSWYQKVLCILQYTR